MYQQEKVQGQGGNLLRCSSENGIFMKEEANQYKTSYHPTRCGTYMANYCLKTPNFINKQKSIHHDHKITVKETRYLDFYGMGLC